jgi:glutathione reductase (NADPH)
MPDKFIGVQIHGGSAAGYSMMPGYRSPLLRDEQASGNNDHMRAFQDGQWRDFYMEYDPDGAGGKGQIKVDADNRSNVPSIFAVGDVTDRVQLTPVAIREGQAFADTFFGKTPHQVDYGCIPSAVFSHPPLAGVGMTEGQARNKLGSVRTYTSDFRAMKNVLAGRNERSLYKLVVDGTTDEIVGIHMIGPDAPEILQAAAIAVKAKLKKADFDATVALHPTMAEELVLMR